MATDAAKQHVRDERAARARAARAFANLRQSDIADALGQSTITVKRMESAQRDISMDDLWTIADTCNVPREFMTYGFDSVPGELRRVHERFDNLAERVDMLAGRWTTAHDLAQATLQVLQPPDEVANGETGTAGEPEPAAGQD
jgi:transcriptional regulator with XRE-family HTH domain